MRTLNERSPKPQLLAALTAALVATLAGAVVADEPRVERTLKIAVDGGEPAILELDGALEPGESRQLYTDDGRLVVVSRDDDVLSLSIDGRTVELPDLTGGGPGAYAFRYDLEADGLHQLEVEEVATGTAQVAHRVLITGGDNDGAGPSVVWHAGPSAAERLEASGALEDLDDEQRRRILEALEDLHGADHPRVHTLTLELDDGDP